MKIAIFSDSIYPNQINGVAKVARDSADTLAGLGHEVRVFSVGDAPSVPFWSYPGERIVLPVGSAYRKALKWGPDVIHSHTPFTIGWEAVMAARKLRVPLVGTHHTFFDHYLKHVHLDNALARRLSWMYLTGHYNRYDLVLSPSEALLLDMQQNGLKSRSRTMPNGIDTATFSPSDEKKSVGQERVVVYMGRLSYEKSVDVVIEAYERVARLYPHSRLLIIGDGPERKKLEEMVKALGLKERVEFAGFLHGTELVRALRRGDVFVTASKSENMPLSVLEAMATGLPVVGVDALGIPEIVKEAYNGFLVEADDAQAMAERVGRLLEDQPMRQSMSRAARLSSLEYNREAHAKKLEEIYSSLLRHA